jgi:hypothetical protein
MAKKQYKYMALIFHNAGAATRAGLSELLYLTVKGTGADYLFLITTVPASLSCHPCFLLSIPTHMMPRNNGIIDT